MQCTRVTAFVAAVLLAVLSFALPRTARAATELTGQTLGGAYFRIVVPDAWNGGLVIWDHGFSFAAPGPVSTADLGPLAALQLQEGYAVAASSYAQAGWALFHTDFDNAALVRVFVKNFGRPTQLLVNGASLGGIVTAQALESPLIPPVAGAFPVCGAVAGSRNWDGAFDLRLLYDDICSAVPGAAIPGGPEGLPAGSSLTTDDVALAVNACTGVLAPPAARTPAQTARLARLLELTKIPENFVVTDMIFATFGMADLVHDPAKLDGHLASWNLFVDYGDPEVNATIERVPLDLLGRLRTLANYTPTGRVGPAKIVSLHTDKDGLVLVENEHEYAEVVPPSHLTTAIAVESVPTHCGFTAAELVAGWESLRTWVGGAPQPSAAQIQGTCQGIAGAGLASGPCRIDPSFVVPDLKARIRPRIPTSVFPALH